MQLDGRHAGAVELLGQLLGAVLGAGEHHDAARRGRQVGEHREPVPGVDVQHVVRHRGHRRLGRVGVVGDRTVEVALDDDVDAGVQRGGEQHPLPLARSAVEDALDRREEAQVGHVVGLVQDGDLHRAEVGVALTDEVLEPPGGGHEHVDAALQRPHLRVLAHAAEDRQGGQAGRRRERRERLVDLTDQLTGRSQDEGPRRTAADGGAPRGVPGGQPGHEGQQEGVGLAGAGAATAKDVPAGQRVGQGGGLDGGRHGDAAVGKKGGQVGGHAEIGEAGGHGEVFRDVCGVSPGAQAPGGSGATLGAARGRAQIKRPEARRCGALGPV